MISNPESERTAVDLWFLTFTAIPYSTRFEFSALHKLNRYAYPKQAPILPPPPKCVLVQSATILDQKEGFSSS
ncbi:hypothetical protein VKT23_008568 [Stygiomarasmius scandens]|uniref:Uncharacterized protein n=1 Tax=Marasmiellus scandens TaxID=2682957 RepID=A0ABR1JHV8_9AGAR